MKPVKKSKKGDDFDFDGADEEEDPELEAFA